MHAALAGVGVSASNVVSGAFRPKNGPRVRDLAVLQGATGGYEVVESNGPYLGQGDEDTEEGRLAAALWESVGFPAVVIVLSVPTLLLGLGIPLLIGRFFFGLAWATSGSNDYPWGLFLGFGERGRRAGIRGTMIAPRRDRAKYAMTASLPFGPSRKLVSVCITGRR